jgi:hypothetical protein
VIVPVEAEEGQFPVPQEGSISSASRVVQNLYGSFVEEFLLGLVSLMEM